MISYEPGMLFSTSSHKLTVRKMFPTTDDKKIFDEIMSDNNLLKDFILAGVGNFEFDSDENEDDDLWSKMEDNKTSDKLCEIVRKYYQKYGHTEFFDDVSKCSSDWLRVAIVRDAKDLIEILQNTDNIEENDT